ncbi:MAG: zf-HC2 domain-containing protein [Clostridiales bacterium]|nr:zf-HC2 domain-containing protein [Clostridiales bacterium]
MKITCDVIKDLLPLYVENMLSDDSVSIVKEHLEQCQECKALLKDMQSSTPIPANSDSSPLLKIKAGLRKKKIQIGIFSALISIIIFVITMLYLTAPEYHYYGDGSIRINEIENGLLMVNFNDNVYGYDIEKVPTEDGTGYEYYITTWNSIWHRLIKKSSKDNIILNPDGERVVAVYFYQAYGNEDKLIYGETAHEGVVSTQPRLAQNYYAFFALVLAIICGVIMFINRDNSKLLNKTLKVFLLPVSYLLAHLIVTVFTKKIFNVMKSLYAIWLLTILLYLAYLMVANYMEQYKNKKN